jgi:hypothetical protein
LAGIAQTNKNTATLSIGAQTLSLDDVKEFFKIAGGANLTVNFPAVLPKSPIGIFYADVVQHGVPSARMQPGPSPAGINGSISIGIGISF